MVSFRPSLIAFQAGTPAKAPLRNADPTHAGEDVFVFQPCGKTTAPLFGISNAAFHRLPQQAQIQKAVEFFRDQGEFTNPTYYDRQWNPDGKVSDLPDRAFRDNCRADLALMNKIMVLLPPQNSTLKVLEQYFKVFDAVVLERGSQIVYLDETRRKSPYQLRRDGNYINISGPNGGMEIWHKQSAALITKHMGELFNLLIMEKGRGVRGIPDYLNDPQSYRRVLVKPGTDGRDLWGNRYVPSPEVKALQAEFEKWLENQ
jgi:hypothetical protein